MSEATYMHDVIQYFDLISDTLEFSFAELSELEYDRRDFSRGLVDGVAYFSDGSRLEFTEKIVIEDSLVKKQSYRYQYVQDGKTIFRYDNADHHPNLPNYPHHKHVGRKIISAIEPTLSQVLDEVREILKQSSAQPPSKPKRRRR